MTDVVIIDGARTAHGAMLGALSDVRAPDLGEAVLEDVVGRPGGRAVGGGAVMMLLSR